jgi:hypothetical protein
MDKINEYAILRSQSVEGLTNAVNQAIDQGYESIGGITVQNEFLLQAMVKTGTDNRPAEFRAAIQ